MTADVVGTVEVVDGTEMNVEVAGIRVGGSVLAEVFEVETTDVAGVEAGVEAGV